MTPAELNEMVDRLAIEADESVVISVAAHGEDGAWSVVGGSALIGSAEMAGSSWLEWREANLGILAMRSLLEKTSHPPHTWAEFDFRIDGWRFLRYSVPISQLGSWLDDIHRRNVFGLPEGEVATLAVHASPRPLQILTHETTSASRLVTGAGRPIFGWYFKLAGDEISTAAGAAPPPAPPGDWILDGIPIAGAAHFLAGFSPATSYRPAGGLRPPWTGGLVVGRIGRTAWLGEIKAGPDYQTFLVSIRRDPARVMLWDLDLDIEEREGPDLVSARRLRLADVQLPSADAAAITVALPTLGKRVTRTVRLFDASGFLLDGTDEFNLLEGIRLRVRSGDHEATSIVGNDDIPTLADRIDGLRRVEAEYVTLLTAGANGRIVANGDVAGSAKLTEL